MALHVRPHKTKSPNEMQDAASVADIPLDAEPDTPSLKGDLFRVLVKIVLVVAAVFVLFGFVFGLYRVGDNYMEPSFKDGDLVMYYRLDRAFEAGDVAVVEYEGRVICGRVIAIGGDRVDIDKRGLLVNGSYQYEPNITEDTTQMADGVTFPLTVPEGSVFLLGDKRTAAVDSRIYGCVSTGDTLGKVMGQYRSRGF